MGRTRLVFLGRPRSQHTQVSIDLHRIGVDNLAADFLCESERQG
jgi:hypothetical protein